jgi:hypothetical protein
MDKGQDINANHRLIKIGVKYRVKGKSKQGM